MYYSIVHGLLLSDIHDCNCGLKAYRGDVARMIFGYVRSWRWGFNIEHLWIARRLGYAVQEVPIEWGHNPDSRVLLVRDCLFTVWELLLLELRRLMSGYPRFQGG